MKPVIEHYDDHITNCRYVRLCLPRQYLIAVRRPRWSMFWWLVRLAWAGCYAKAPT